VWLALSCADPNQATGTSKPATKTMGVVRLKLLQSVMMHGNMHSTLYKQRRLHVSHQSINQSINQSIDSSIDQSIDKSVSLLCLSLGLIRGVNRQ